MLSTKKSCFYLTSFISLFFYAPVLNVRLVNGDSRCSGRVEILHDGQWGTVFGDGWDLTDASVVCSEMGCGDAVQVLNGAHFGRGSGKIWMNDVDCSGSECTLKNCTSSVSDCDHDKDVGVICSSEDIIYIIFNINVILSFVIFGFCICFIYIRCKREVGEW